MAGRRWIGQTVAGATVLLCVGAGLVFYPHTAAGAAAAGGLGEPGKPVSFYKEVRPIFQANCLGCHQPAKAKGKYVMTDFPKLLKGAEKTAIVPGKPGQSNLIKMITPVDGEAQMPDDKKPLHDVEIELIKRWVAEGAVDDSPENARARFDPQHPPVYSRPPVVTSIDYSPDGKVIAIAGFHEVLLSDAESGKRVGRLVGLSERIESVKFSPDGKKLAVAAGLPCRTGEIQIWNTQTRKLTLSVPVTFDTVYGINWSPDGKLVSVGCSDKSVRAFDAESGEQVLFQGAHDDWALATVFSVDGSQLISVGRDGTSKLTDVATQRFIDNITSITPGALKGGLQAVARHPTRDEIVIGGSDGVPKVYRIERQTKRVIGDDACIIRELPGMTGRIFSVAVSPDGKRIAAASTLDNVGEVRVFGYEFDTALPEDIKKIFAKTVPSWSPDEKKTVEAYKTKDVTVISKLDLKDSGVYTLAFSPDSKTLAAAGSDGKVRLIDPETGKLIKAFNAAPVEVKKTVAASMSGELNQTAAPVQADDTAKDIAVASIAVEPAEVQLLSRFDYAQVIVTGKTKAGETVDLTRNATFGFSQRIADISTRGVVRPIADGQGTLKVTVGGKSVDVPVLVNGTTAAYHIDFIRDVNPVMSKLGCNQGTCHGSAKGKNGFKLSLRGYDPIFDIRALTDDHASRRVAVASPDDSLMLLKPTGVAPHEGGVLFKPGDKYYQVLRDWIADGAKLDLDVPRVTKIEVHPTNPVVQVIGSRQQFRVIATYSDGKTRDVTSEAFIDTGNAEVATVDKLGLATSVRRGEAPLLARYEGAYAATTLTVMGDRTGFTWKQPPANNRVDELAAEKWKRVKTQPSELCTDVEFVRRVYLDLTGLPPTPDDVRAFTADTRESKLKRDELVDKLVGSPEFVEYWTNKWADLLQVNRKFLGPEGASAFRGWIRENVAKNTPYNQFAYSILTASGSNRENPAASYYKILREPEATMENTTHLFLAVRFNCNKCHDHPFERWTQDQYYQTSAFFARLELKPDPKAAGMTLGGTAVEKPKPMYEIIDDAKAGEVMHLRTNKVAPPTFPYAAKLVFEHNDKADAKPEGKADSQSESQSEATRREQLAAWITSPDNQFFAKSYVNRLWGYTMGRGIIEPIDDIRAGNPPTNPALLDYLTQEFIGHNFDSHHIFKLICKSRTYQLSIETNRWNADDTVNYSHAAARRLPAEVLYDAVERVTGTVSKFPGVKPGTRAAELPDSGIDLPSGFLSTFGRPVRESACECERQTGLQLGPIMSLVSGPTIADAIADPSNALTKLVAEEKDDRKLVDALFMRILNRPATEQEIAVSLEAMGRIADDNTKLGGVLKTYEPKALAAHAEFEAKRNEALTKARDEQTAYEKQIAPAVAAAKAEQQKKTEAAEVALTKFTQVMPRTEAEWEASLVTAAAPEMVKPDQTSKGGKIKKAKPDPTVTKPVKKPAEAAAKPADKPEAKPADKPVAKPAAKSADKPADKAADKAAVKPAGEAAQKKAPEVAAAPAKPVVEPVAWVPLTFKTLDVSGGKGSLKALPDGSIRSLNAPDTIRLIYKAVADVNLDNITAVKLEVLPDETLPGFGPGFDGSGNFVLTEFQAAFEPAEPPAADAKADAKPDPKAKGKKARPVRAAKGALAGALKIDTAVATFNQKGDFDVTKAIDGDVQSGSKGWAVGGGTGKRQEAIFHFAQPIKAEHGGTLTVSLTQGFRQGFTLGRFRLWVTTAAKPNFGLPVAVADVLKVEADQRTDEHKAVLAEYRKLTDDNYIRREKGLWAARKPLPRDPKLVQMETTVADLSKPTPLDPKLVQLRQDVATSGQQATNNRLTGAQDIAWALINSPAFLFNH